MSNLYRIEDMRRLTQEEFRKSPEAVIAMAKDGSGPIVIENKDKKQKLVLMSWDEYLKMQEAIYGAEARDALDAAVKRSVNSQCNTTGEDLGDSGEDEPLEEDYDIQNLNPRKNPYAKKIKQVNAKLHDDDIAHFTGESDKIGEDAFLEKPFEFSRAVKNPYAKKNKEENSRNRFSLNKE